MGSQLARSAQSMAAAAARIGVLSLLSLGAISMFFAPPAMAATGSFVVNIGTTDLADKNKGDGVCADINNQCSLRAAIEEIADLVRHIINSLNGSYVIVTADHGFLFQETPPGPTDKTGRSMANPRDAHQA